MRPSIELVAESLDNGFNKMNIIAQNLANISTDGYKKDVFHVESFPETLQGHLDGEKTLKVRHTTSFAPGTFKFTGNPLDVANRGDGFFTVQIPSGPVYTRAGSFSLDSAGYIVTKTGDKVLGDNDEPIQVPSEGDLKITKTGDILVDGAKIATFKMAEFEHPYPLKKIGNTYFAAPEGTVPKTGETTMLSQGYTELSNVSSVESLTEMIHMMSTARTSETNKEILTMYGKTTEQVINRIGRVS